MDNNSNKILAPVFENSADPDEACTLVGKVYQPHSLSLCRASDSLSAKMDHSNIAETSISELTYNAKIHIESEPFKNFYLVMLPFRGQFEVTQGNIEQIASVGKPVVLDSDKHLDMYWSRQCANLIFKINRGLIDRTLFDSYGIEAKTPVQFSYLHGAPNDLERFSTMLYSLILENPYLADMKNHMEMFKKIEQVLALSLVSGNHSYTDKILTTKYRVQPKVVLKAKEFMEENYQNKITVVDISQSVGVTARCLQKGFEQYEYTTPMVYLRKLRLRKARDLLVFSRSENVGIKISEIAMRCGFYHFGNFSKLYFNEFGESPSATLSGRP